MPRNHEMHSRRTRTGTNLELNLNKSLVLPHHPEALSLGTCKKRQPELEVLAELLSLYFLRGLK